MVNPYSAGTRTLQESAKLRLAHIAVGRPVARTAPAQIPACRVLAPGSSEILVSASGIGKEKPAL